MRTLLLADDSITVQRVIALTFADEQIRVVTVADGQQAIERMAAQKPDIVLAGTTLPQVSGYDLARFIRNKPELQHVPVLLLSGAFESVDAARLKASGANGVLEKPVEPTIVIGRVKELLGLKGDAKPSAGGRLVTPAAAPAERTMPVPTPPRAVTSTRGTPSRWEQLRDQTGLDSNTRSVEDSSTRADDYLDTLDAAFDTLDRQLSGRSPAAKPQRNPSGPLGQASGAPDPRSPGRSPHGAPHQGNQVFEVDEEWFGGTESHARADARAGRREIAEDLSHPDLRPQQPSTAAANPIYEVDDEWFAENEKARAERLAEQQRLTAEMGLHDVDLSAVTAAPAAPPLSADDLRFSIDDIAHVQAAPARAPQAAVAPPPTRVIAPPQAAQTPPAPLPAAIAPLPSGFAREQTGDGHRNSRQDAAAIGVSEPAKPAPEPVAVTPMPPAPPAAPAPLADDFAALLAFEQGERPHPPRPEPPAPEVKLVAPEITDEMLDQIAARVAERLSASAFGNQLRDAMAATMKDTVRSVVSETSERLVRDEIERIKSRHKS